MNFLERIRNFLERIRDRINDRPWKLTLKIWHENSLEFFLDFQKIALGNLEKKFLIFITVIAYKSRFGNKKKIKTFFWTFKTDAINDFFKFKSAS